MEIWRGLETIQKKLRKGDLVKVDRLQYINSLESLASDANLPEYIRVTFRHVTDDSKI